MIALSRTQSALIARMLSGCRKQIDRQNAILAASIQERKEAEALNQAREAVAFARHQRRVKWNLALAERGLYRLLALSADSSFIEMVGLNEDLVSPHNRNEGLLFYGAYLKHGGVYLSFHKDCLYIGAGRGEPGGAIDSFISQDARLKDDEFIAFNNSLFDALNQTSGTRINVRLAQSRPELDYDYLELLARLLIYCASPRRLSLLVTDFLVAQEERLRTYQELANLAG